MSRTPATKPLPAMSSAASQLASRQTSRHPRIAVPPRRSGDRREFPRITGGLALGCAPVGALVYAGLRGFLG